MKAVKAKNKKSLRLTRRIFIAGTVLLVSLGLFGCFVSQKSNLIISASPSTTADDLVYFADAAGRIHALRSDGQLQWQYSLTDDLAARGKETIGEIRIDRLFARSDKKLYALARIETGDKAGNMILYALNGNQLIWFKDAPQPEQDGTPIAIDDKALYLAGNDGNLYAFARDDGRMLWQYQVSPGRIGAPSLGADGMIYVTGPMHNLHAIGVDGKQRWIIETNPQ